MTIGYITIGAHDVEAALPFFDAALGAIGYRAARPTAAGPSTARRAAAPASASASRTTASRRGRATAS